MIRRDAGIALVVVMLLLLGLSVVALAGLGGAAADLAIAAAGEQAALALEAAETGIARTLRSGAPIPAGTAVWPELHPGITVSTEIRFDPPDPDSPLLEQLPGQEGGAPLLPRHFAILAEARTSRGMVARIEQGYQSLWPPEDPLCETDDCAVWPSGVLVAPAPPIDLGTDPVKTSWRPLETMPD
jgi:hypothetical protein